MKKSVGAKTIIYPTPALELIGTSVSRLSELFVP